MHSGLDTMAHIERSCLNLTRLNNVPLTVSLRREYGNWEASEDVFTSLADCTSQIELAVRQYDFGTKRS